MADYTRKGLFIILFIVVCILIYIIYELIFGDLQEKVIRIKGERMEANRLKSGGKKPTKNIFDITGVQNDLCILHTPHAYDIFTPELKKRCEETKFALGSPLDVKYNQVNIAMHNRGQICLAGCLMSWQERVRALFKLMKGVKTLMREIGETNWVVYYGSLIGWIRERKLLDWDPDIDILVPHDFNKRFGNERKVVKEIGDIVLRSGHRNPNIAGTIEDKSTGLYCDLFAYTVKNDSQMVEIRWVPTPGRPVLKVPIKDFLPIRQEKFYGPDGEEEILPIPQNPDVNMKERYGKGFMTPPYERKGDKFYLAGPKISGTMAPIENKIEEEKKD